VTTEKEWGDLKSRVDLLERVMPDRELVAAASGAALAASESAKILDGLMRGGGPSESVLEKLTRMEGKLDAAERSREIIRDDVHGLRGEINSVRTEAARAVTIAEAAANDANRAIEQASGTTERTTERMVGYETRLTSVEEGLNSKLGRRDASSGLIDVKQTGERSWVKDVPAPVWAGIVSVLGALTALLIYLAK
tara:strand:- start:12814 stop:13398 length:585 start_codon:yes stop_codon:yes gene_type:complete